MINKTIMTLGAIVTFAAIGMIGQNAQANEVNSNTYEVKSGDTLWDIANTNGFDLLQLQTMNNKLENTLIVTGEVLTTPGEVLSNNFESVSYTSTEPVSEASTQEVSVDTTDTTVTSGFTANSAKEFIAQKESSGSYSATNGKYIGRYQLDSSYLNGDYSESNQERVADQYVEGRYGSWEAAQAFWISNGWY